MAMNIAILPKSTNHLCSYKKLNRSPNEGRDKEKASLNLALPLFQKYTTERYLVGKVLFEHGKTIQMAGFHWKGVIASSWNQQLFYIFFVFQSIN